MPLSDEQIKKMAKQRTDFKMHAGTYIIINVMLAGIWFLASRGAPYWPVWTHLFWGVGLAFHAFNTYAGMQEKEEEKLRKRYQ